MAYHPALAGPDSTYEVVGLPAVPLVVDAVDLFVGDAAVVDEDRRLNLVEASA